MVFDCHIHMTQDYDKQSFVNQMSSAGVDGGIIFSNAPNSFNNKPDSAEDAKLKLEKVLNIAEGNKYLFPFFWIDPLEEDAEEQVDRAVEAGIRGFKVICLRHYPQDDRPMKIWERIAKKGKPILFHSGILYNPGPSSEYNRPVNFEHLFFIDNLTFACAHISWPWCDELIAVFGKWNSLAREKSEKITSTMYIDSTPGTPPIYREDPLTKLIKVGYVSMYDQIMFGTDNSSNYRDWFAKDWMGRDNAIFDKLGVKKEVRDKYFGGNMLKFVGEV